MIRFDKRDFKQEMEQVEQYLSEYLRDPGCGGAVAEILADLKESKGKRLRPGLLLMAGRYGEGFVKEREKLCRLAALVELVHMASLVHDDIVDDAPIRRGLPTTQAKYGKDMAVYAGDLILSRIVQSLFRDGFEPVGKDFGDTVEAMCLGELGQMECRFQENTTPDRYMRNIYGKTAALCRLACVAGARMSGCSVEIQARLEQLGIHFGYMFQIRDDLLDYVSDAAAEGKMTQMDFREGILTLPVLYAMEKEEFRSPIIDLIRSAKAGTFSAEDARELTRLTAVSGGMRRAVQEMERHAALALRAIENLPDHGVSDVFRELLETRCRIPEMKNPDK